MICVCFYGDLRQFGSKFKLEAESPADALKGLLSQIKGLREHIENGVYQVRVGGKDLSADNLEDNFVKHTEDTIVHLVPRTLGAGKNGGIVQAVVGIIIIAVCWWNPLGWGSAAAIAGGGYSAFGAGVMFGAAMLMGGITQMLTKPPKFGEAREGQAASNSTSFSNIDNISAQGKPVPIIYGICYVGSRVISQGIESYRPAISTTPDIIQGKDITLGIEREYTNSKAVALAPNGQPYNTDFNNDSVKARNYIARFTEGA